MIEQIFNLVLVLHVALIVPLLAVVSLASRLADRVVAFDAVSIVFVSGFAVLGLQRGETFYFDIALVVAMVGFVQTVAVARLLARRRELE